MPPRQKAELAELLEAQPPEFAKYGATIESELLESDEARPPGIAKYSLTTSRTKTHLTNVASTATSETVPHASGMRAQDVRRLHRRPSFHGKLDVVGDEVAAGGDFIGSHCTVVL